LKEGYFEGAGAVVGGIAYGEGALEFLLGVGGERDIVLRVEFKHLALNISQPDAAISKYRINHYCPLESNGNIA
jgi:hypothetical protein